MPKRVFTCFQILQPTMNNITSIPVHPQMETYRKTTIQREQLEPCCIFRDSVQKATAFFLRSDHEKTLDSDHRAYIKLRQQESALKEKQELRAQEQVQMNIQVLYYTAFTYGE